jgi:hypothetical protein
MADEREEPSHALVDAYDGVPYEHLPVDELVWTEDAAMHLRTRSVPHPGDCDLEVEWAAEAALDPQRLIGDGRSRDGLSVRIIGFSETFGGLLKVWAVADDHPPTGRWWLRTACPANSTDRREYNNPSEGGEVWK